MRRYKLTAAFLVISAITLAVAAIVILNVSKSQEERNIAGLTTEQSARDARLLAGSVSRTISDGMSLDAEGGAIAGTTTGSTEASIREFLAESNIIRLALYEIDGRSVWSSDGRDTQVAGEREEIFKEAVAGEVVSGMMRGNWFPGFSEPIDIVETYVPFLGANSDAPVQVLGVTRDVTDLLSARIGETRWAMFRVTFISLGGGFALLLAFIVIADRAIWRSKDREIRKERELGDERIASTRLDIENRELQKLNEDRGKLISLVSHELRTPLTSVLAFTDILRKRQSGPGAEKNIELLSVIKRSGTQLLEMIEEMLDLSRLESTELSLDETEFDVSVFVAETAQKIEPILHAKSQKLQIFGDVDGCWIRADRNRLDQVLVNLLSNASKYSPAGTPIELEVTAGTSELRVAVRDHGFGIAEEDQHRIFGKFFRVDREETRKISGTGLGLSIVKSIIDQHDGEISVTSQPGRGTTFSFWIPARVRRPLAATVLRPATPWGYPAGRQDVPLLAGHGATTTLPLDPAEVLGEIA